MINKTYNLGAIEIFANDVYYKNPKSNKAYPYLTWYEAEDFLNSIKNSGDWRIPALNEILFLDQEYKSLNLLSFSNRSAYWIYDEVLSNETSEDWSIGYYFGGKGNPGRRGGIPKSELLCLRPVRSI
jgi:hypothetical protein